MTRARSLTGSACSSSAPVFDKRAFPCLSLSARRHVKTHWCSGCRATGPGRRFSTRRLVRLRKGGARLFAARPLCWSPIPRPPRRPSFRPKHEPHVIAIRKLRGSRIDIDAPYGLGQVDSGTDGAAVLRRYLDATDQLSRSGDTAITIETDYP